jgi:ketosteroid isomerase-like protein
MTPHTAHSLRPLIPRNHLLNLVYRILPAALALTLLIPAESTQAAETAETILIRQALEKDRSGRRRGDAELVLSAYDDDRIVVYDAGGSIDGRNWSVLHDSRDEVATALETDLSTRRYDIQRQVIFIGVWKNKAFVTTIDSGATIDGASGSRTPYAQSRLWTFRKLDEEWLATAVIVALGDTTDGPAAGRVEADDVAQAVQAHAAEWSNDSHSGVLGGLTEDVVIVDSYFSTNPAKWLIVFSDHEEFDEWLDDRLQNVDYAIESTVLHAVAKGDEAVAVSRQRITATYASGESQIVEDRYNTWLLTRSGSSWLVDWAWWKTKPYDDLGEAATSR